VTDICGGGGNVYEEGGFRGLFDRRRGQPSPKRVPMVVLERVLELYREKYFDLDLRHFHEKLGSEHQIGLSYRLYAICCVRLTTSVRSC
jgi:hypothetical protein